eukprot:gene36336-44826_t
MLKSRDFNLDTTSKIILSSGSFIEALISSGVHRYLEFKSVEGVYFYINEHNTKALQNELWKVPCSRTDVFNTTKLTVLEKRVLMKFYSFVLDYGKENYSNIEVSSLNEIELASGRSLYRPQTKQPTVTGEASSSSGYNVSKFLTLPFEDFLTDSKISKRLQSIIMYALSLRTTSVASQATSALTPEYTTASGVFDLYQHINSLGRFGETAFLCPLYGTGEMAQAFCRMSAVWGGIFVLRRHIDAVRIENVVSDVNSEEVTAETSTASSTTVAPKLTHVRDSTGRTFTCDNFVCNIQQWPSTLSAHCTQFSVTRVSVCTGYLLPLSRSVVIIPPFATYTTAANGEQIELKNSYAIHVIQSADNSTYAGISGTSVLHITTTVDVVSDDNSNNNSSNWRDLAARQQSQVISLMDSIAALLQHSQYTASSAPEDNTCDGAGKHSELCHATTMTPMYATLNGVNNNNTQSDLTSSSTTPPIPINVGLCFDSGESFHLSRPVEQARQIFSKLFPGKAFLPSEEDLAAAAAEKAGKTTTEGENAEGVEGESVATFSVPYSTGELSEADQETRYLENTLKALSVQSTTVTSRENNDKESEVEKNE